MLKRDALSAFASADSSVNELHVAVDSTPAVDGHPSKGMSPVF